MVSTLFRDLGLGLNYYLECLFREELSAQGAKLSKQG